MASWPRDARTAPRSADRAPAPAASTELEGDGVLCWRFEQLAAAGCDARTAAVLARARSVDLHAALDLIDRGCPPETALRILL